MLRLIRSFRATRLAKVASASRQMLTVTIAAVGFTTATVGEPTADAAPPRAENMYDMAASGFVKPPTGTPPPGAFVPAQFGGTAAMAAPPGGQSGYPGGSPGGNMGGYPGGNPNAYPAQPSAAMATSSLPMTAAIQGVPMQGGGYPGGVMPVGFMSSSCDAMPMYESYGQGGCSPSGCGGCDGGCSSGSCGGCPMRSVIHGGVLGKLIGNDCGCDASGGEMSSLRHMCLFCQGSGCSACQLFSPAAMVGALRALAPYSEQGKCAQRWFDISVEGMFLSHNNDGFGGVNGGLISTIGPDDPNTPGIDGVPALFLGDADPGGDLAAGVRIAGSLISGPGGAIEAIYIGGQEWDDSASAVSPNPDIYSFISGFGDPTAFDDTDESFRHTLTRQSSLHSVELNYRRRVVGPYCRFQGSWVAGMRYLNFKNSTQLDTVGADDNGGPGPDRFATFDNELDNNMLGGQVGFDLWYSWVPGINLGIAGKGGWLHNDARQDLDFVSNSSPFAAPNGLLSATDSDSQVTTMGEFEATMLYRLTHSWTVRSSYFLMAIDDVAVSGVDPAPVQNFVNGQNISASQFRFDSVVFQGFSIGAEYVW